MLPNQEGRNKYFIFSMQSKWEQICGANVAKHSKPVRLERKVLYINTDSSVWANHLLMMKQQFINNINRVMTNDPVRDIKFFTGSIENFLQLPKEEQEVKPATDLVVDNNSVTLLQGDEITVSITSGNGDYYVKPFDENVATATINGNKVTIKATENSQLEENNRTETTILIVDGRKKVARVLVRVAKLWDLTVDAPEEGFDLFIGEKRLVKILTGNGDYQISIPEGADKFLEVGELSGQVIPLTAKFETGADPVNITITDKNGTKSSTKEAYKMYINGVRETLTPADNSYEDCAPNSSLNLTDVGGNDKALLIGRSGDSYRVGYCKVYQARMWKRALDESEIKANMCKILNAEEHSDLMGYWVFSKGVGGTTVFENWGNGGSGLDAQVCLQNISENKPAWGAELPATYNGDKSRFEPIECPHSY